MIFTIEPMINAGRREIREMPDGWTIKTKDRSLSAQWEHMILVTETGYEVLTTSAGTPPPPAIVLNKPTRRRGLSPAVRPCLMTAPPSTEAQQPQLQLKLKQRLKAERQLIIADFRENGKPEKLLRGLRQSVDGVLSDAWRAAGCRRNGPGRRRRLRPRRTVPLLRRRPADPARQAPDALTQAQSWSNFVQLLWDLGLEIGHSIRTVDECMSESAADITVQTSLLEARLVDGSEAVFAELQRATPEAMDAQAFFHAKTAEMRLRHAKYEFTALQPGAERQGKPGRLRDLQVILWVAKAAGLANSWTQLAIRGLITREEARQLMEKEYAFKDIRIRLHLQTKRREDRLVFDVQTAIAETFGLTSTGHGLEARRASEYLMQRYYWAAKTVTQMNTILLQNIEAQLFPQPIAAGADQPALQRSQRLHRHRRRRHLRGESRRRAGNLRADDGAPDIKGMTARTMRALWHART
jgi:[protein-PII] uridylyltransferase